MIPVKQCGFIVNTLFHNQLTYYLIKNLNEYISSQVCAEIDPILFYEDMKPSSITPLCSTMHVAECWTYNAPVIATTLSGANKLINIPGPTKKFYYPYNLEWIRPQIPQYEAYAKVFCDPQLHIIARNEDHKLVIENCFNIKVAGIVNDFDIKELIGIIYDKN
jgi:hypothetical protein